MPLRKAKFRDAALRGLRSKATANLATFQAGTPPVSPQETIGFASEEEAIIDYLRERQPRWSNMWAMLNELGNKDSTHWVVSRPSRQRLLATLVRLIGEQKVLYAWRDRSCLLNPRLGQLSPSGYGPMGQDARQFG